VVWELVAQEILAIELERPAETMWLTGASRALFDCFDHLITVVTEAYTDESERRLRGREQRRTRAVARVLSGEPASSDELGYRLEGHHVAMVVRGTGAETAARAIAATMKPEALVISQTDELAWLWLGSRERFSDRIWKQLEAQLPPGVRVAAGDCEAGKEGFRLSHRQAQTADRIAGGSERSLIRYSEVALLAAVLEHETARASFVASFLGELAGPGKRNAALRETLNAYFAAGQNAASAAAALGVSARTVRDRLRAIEELLGQRIDARRAELEVALRMVAAGAGARDAPPLG
jgi:sugar diacid utilization regulator